jgi:hypothetical protein
MGRSSRCSRSSIRPSSVGRSTYKFRLTAEQFLEALIVLEGAASLGLVLGMVYLGSNFIAFGALFWPTGPGPVFRDYQGLFRPFWDRLRLRENR